MKRAVSKRDEPKLPWEKAGGATGATRETAAVSKHGIWSQQGQQHHSSPVTASATSTSAQLRVRAKHRKTEVHVFGMSQGVSSLAAPTCSKDLLAPSTRLPTGAQDGAGLVLGHHRAGAPEADVSAHKRGAFALPRSPCSGSPLSPASRNRRPLRRSQLAAPHSRVSRALPFPGAQPPQDPAPASLVSWQCHELVMLWVRPAPHLIAPLARSKINSTLYTLAASALMFWHICEVKKKK